MRALLLNTAAVLFAHNHPGATVEPSEDDLRLTKHLKKALALVDIGVLDHLVVTGGAATSFAERGVL